MKKYEKEDHEAVKVGDATEIAKECGDCESYRTIVERLKVELREVEAERDALKAALENIRAILNRMGEQSQENAENLDLTQMWEEVEAALDEHPTS